jgi:asparagine synthase (glutamine-hydrolysing)
MCGIAGVFGTKEYTASVINPMLAAITHRGPDDQGELCLDAFSFGMRRLSIIDLAGGHQPIWNEDRTVVIVFNGEIYNYLELHDELVAKGHVFQTKSDTETIVHLYEEYGRTAPHDMLRKLRGMFAFAIYDLTTDTMMIARDHFGIKPLYYRTDGLDTYPTIAGFGSEIKSLLKDTHYKPEVNHEAINNYLAFQFNPLSETCFKHIHILPPGSVMHIDVKKRTFAIDTFWSYTFADAQHTRTDAEGLATDIRNTITDSVVHHMISDVPVGAFLSGGIDSAITVTLMQQERMKLGLDPVKTFTIGFDEVSEHETAREVSDTLHTDHHEIKISFDEYFNELPNIAWHFDEPVADPSAVALYFLAREARKHVKVVLSGEGSDELFGGYNIYREPFSLAPISRLPQWVKHLCIKPLTALPFNFFGKNYLRRAITPFNDRYIGNAYIFKPHESQALWKPAFRSRVQSTPAAPSSDSSTAPRAEDASAVTPHSHETHTSTPPSQAHVFPGYELEKTVLSFSALPESRKMQLVDMHYWLRGDILAKADKMTMAHSLELRVPYLDREVAAISGTIDDSLKYAQGTTKYILRKAFESILPKTTAGRKKLGFPTPMRDWLKKRPQDIMRIIRNNTYINTHFETEYIESLLNNHLNGKADNARKIYVLLMLALWYNQYIAS